MVAAARLELGSLIRGRRNDMGWADVKLSTMPTPPQDAEAERVEGADGDASRGQRPAVLTQAILGFGGRRPREC